MPSTTSQTSSAARTKIAQLEAEIAAIRSRAALTPETPSEARAKIAQLEADIADLTARNARIKSEIAALSAAKPNVEARLRAMNPFDIVTQLVNKGKRPQQAVALTGRSPGFIARAERLKSELGVPLEHAVEVLRERLHDHACRMASSGGASTLTLSDRRPRTVMDLAVQIQRQRGCTFADASILAARAQASLRVA